MQVVIYLAALALFAGLAQAPVFAAEVKCEGLGARCVCSEPFNTMTYTPIFGSWFDPADSPTQACTTEFGLPAGAAVTRNVADVTAGTDAAALAALPAGHRVQAFLRAADGHTGIFYVGHSGFPNKPRIAARWYMYHTPDFEFAGDGACQNSKLLEFVGPQAFLDKSFGSVHMYNFLTWSVAKDCCQVGPGPQNVSRQDWRGKWFRVEVVVTHPAGPGTNVEVWVKNVTDNGPELKVVDLSQACPECGPDGGWVPSSTLTPPLRIFGLVSNHFRQGLCQGWLGVSHYLAAAWDTSAGQRLGPALEVEPAAVGAERRCEGLGSQCVCSEPFNTVTYTPVFGSWYDPGDSVTRGCMVEAGLPPGAAVTRNRADVRASADDTALAALPAGHEVHAFLRAADGHTGIFAAGHAVLPDKPRIAARWYLYHTPDFQFAGDGACQDSELLGFGHSGQGFLAKSFGYVQMYNFLNWSVAEDCCWVGPGPQNVGKEDWLGKWYRIEVVVRNPAGPGTNVEVYLKNVTDDGPELKVVDLSQPCPGCGPGDGWVPSATLTPPARISALASNHYREGVCAGSVGISHYVAAAWETDAGQRIGPAPEVEPAAPAAP